MALSAHNPEVAGSNPAPATNVVAGQRPFPIGRGPLTWLIITRDRHIQEKLAEINAVRTRGANMVNLLPAKTLAASGDNSRSS